MRWIISSSILHKWININIIKVFDVDVVACIYCKIILYNKRARSVIDIVIFLIVASFVCSGRKDAYLAPVEIASAI